MKCNSPNPALAKRLVPFAFLALGLPLGAQGPAELAERARLTTFGLDPQDYNEVAQSLSSSILVEERFAESPDKVLVLGPVDTEDNYFPLDTVLLQERIQTTIQRSGVLAVFFAANVIPEESAQEALRNIVKFDYYTTDADAAATEDLRHLSTLEEIDYLLFGRVSSMVRYHRDYKEVTFVFNWKIGDTRTGLIEWTDEMELTKSGELPEVPQWYVAPPEDSSRNLYETGYATDSSEQRAIEKAIDSTAEGFRIKLDREYAGYSWIDDFGQVFSPGDIQLAITRTRAVRRQRQAWVLVRLDQRHMEEQRARRDEAIDFLTRFEEDLAAARQAFLIDAHADAYRTVRRLEERLDQRARDPDGVYLREYAYGLLADFEVEAGNPAGARRHYQQLLRSTESNRWRERATSNLTRLTVSEEDELKARVRSLFGGEKVLVLAGYRTEGNSPVEWRKAESSVNDLVARGWGAATNGRDLITSWPSENGLGELAASIAAERNTESSFVVAADGKFETRDNEDHPMGEDVRFVGDLTIGYTVDARNSRIIEQRVFTGWNRFGREMCMDMLALQALDLWKNRYLKEE